MKFEKLCKNCNTIISNNTTYQFCNNECKIYYDLKKISKKLTQLHPQLNKNSYKKSIRIPSGF